MFPCLSFSKFNFEKSCDREFKAVCQHSPFLKDLNKIPTFLWKEVDENSWSYALVIGENLSTSLAMVFTF